MFPTDYRLGLGGEIRGEDLASHLSVKPQFVETGDGSRGGNDRRSSCAFKYKSHLLGKD